MPWPAGFTRAVLFFHAPEGDGWSEEYLANNDDVDDSDMWASGIALHRLGLLYNTYSLSWVRINHPDKPRTLLPYTNAPHIGAPGTFAPVGGYQRSEVGGLVKFFTTSGRYSNRIFRGVDEAAVNTDGTFNVAEDWTIAMNAFMSYLIATAKVGLINTKVTAGNPAYTFELYTSAQLLRSTTRDSGRPFGLRRGRSAA